MLNSLHIFLILLAWLLVGIIILLCRRKIVIYIRETGQIIAIVKPLIYSKQILHKDLDFSITTDNINLTHNNGKVYINKEESKNE